MKNKKPTIEIMPDGSIREKKKTKRKRKSKLKVLTMREDLGGEYSNHIYPDVVSSPFGC